MATYLEMYRGDDEDFAVAVVDPEGEPVDLTDTLLRFTAKRDATDADDDAVITKTTGAGIEVVDPATDGLATISILAADTDDLGRETVLVWDLQVTDGEDKVRTLASGTLRVRVDVSRTTP